MGMGSQMIVSSAYWGSDSDDDYYITSVSNMARKRKKSDYSCEKNIERLANIYQIEL